MNEAELLELAGEHVAQAFALLGQVQQRQPDDQENLSTAQSRLASATRHMRRVQR